MNCIVHGVAKSRTERLSTQKKYNSHSKKCRNHKHSVQGIFMKQANHVIILHMKEKNQADPWAPSQPLPLSVPTD